MKFLIAELGSIGRRVFPDALKKHKPDAVIVASSASKWMAKPYRNPFVQTIAKSIYNQVYKIVNV
jgi:hypothetical protein